MITSFNRSSSIITRKMLFVVHRDTYESASSWTMDTLQNVLVEDPISTETVNLGKSSHIIIRPDLKNE